MTIIYVGLPARRVLSAPRRGVCRIAPRLRSPRRNEPGAPTPPRPPSRARGAQPCPIASAVGNGRRHRHASGQTTGVRRTGCPSTDPGDNRFTLASLTAAGEERVAELRAAHGEFQERLLAGIGRGDRKTVVRVLEQLRANLRALEADVQGRTEKGHADDDTAAQSARSEGV